MASCRIFQQDSRSKCTSVDIKETQLSLSPVSLWNFVPVYPTTLHAIPRHFTPCHSLINALFHPFLHSLIQPFIHSFIPFIRSFRFSSIRLIHSCTHSFIHSSIISCIHSFIRSDSSTLFIASLHRILSSILFIQSIHRTHSLNPFIESSHRLKSFHRPFSLNPCIEYFHQIPSTGFAHVFVLYEPGTTNAPI